MKVKDTVIDDRIKDLAVDHQLLVCQMLKTQAEISFKAGYKQRDKEIIAKARQPEAGNIYFEAGKQVGRQEVLDWFFANGYSGGAIHYSDGVKARFDPPWDKLQAQLKSWKVK